MVERERQSSIKEQPPEVDILYKVEDVPSPPLCFLFGLQQAVMCIGGTLSIPFIISGLICADGRNDVTSKLLSITMFMCGIATLLQCIFGIRLGIIQGGSHTFLAPIVAMMTVEKWRCPETDGAHSYNGTDDAHDDEIWKSRIREIQGNLILASLTQVVLGCTGLMGIFIPFIGPLTIAPTISLIGLSLTGVVIDFNKNHWGIAALSMALTLIFSIYTGHIKIPIPVWTRQRSCHIIRYPLFQLFPVILSICLSWIFCAILTETNVFPTNRTDVGYLARTDSRIDILYTVPWLYFPYPFHFGTPTVSAGGYVGFLAATLSSIVESIGDYHAAARISGSPPPPSHAVNRGIAMEGFCSIISGIVGASHGTTSYSGNIGAIGITKVASRAVFITAGVILLICGIIGKFGAVLTLIPDPIIGGTLTVLFGMVAAVGVSTLKFINLESTRNLTILGVSLILGLMIPQFVNDPKNADAINTGNEELDQAIKVLLGTAMFVGGFVGFLLDNTVPGTYADRGIISWRLPHIQTTETQTPASTTMYDVPFVTKLCKRIPCCSYVPVSPTFGKDITNCKSFCCESSTKDISNVGLGEMYENAVSTASIIIDSENNATHL